MGLGTYLLQFLTSKLSVPYKELRIQFVEPEDEVCGFNISFQSASQLIQRVGVFRFPFSIGEIESALSTVDSFAKNWVQRSEQFDKIDPLKEIGAQLFSALFDGSVIDIYQSAMAEATSIGVGLRIRLIFHDTALTSLPWEFLYDPFRRDFIGLSEQISIVRDSAELLVNFADHSPLDRIRILMVACNIHPSMNLPGIKREIDALSEISRRDDKIELEVIENASPEKFLMAINQNEYEVIIFSGNADQHQLRQCK